MMSSNTSLPELPEPTLKPLPPLLSWISDFHLSLFLPMIAYWLLSLFYWTIDTFEFFPQCRLHTPAESRQRNRVSTAEVVRAVVLQQLNQIAFGLVLGYFLGSDAYHGQEDYEIARWGLWIRGARRRSPLLLNVFGVDGRHLSQRLYGIWQSFAHHSLVSLTVQSKEAAPYLSFETSQYAFTAGDLWMARVVFWYLEPAFRFVIAILFSDAWQYFCHRAFHANKWLYRECIQQRF